MPIWAFQTRLGPSEGQLVDQPVSFEMPLWLGPRQRGQSSPGATPDWAKAEWHVAASRIEGPCIELGSRLLQAVSTRTP